MQAKEKIGFIGVGLMGHGIARNLVDKGNPLTFLRGRNAKTAADLVEHGAVEASSVAEVAARSDIVFVCVTGSPEVESVIFGPAGLATALKRGSVIVDCSTSDPISTDALTEKLAPLGIAYADAPLGGTPNEAWAGTLGAMVGASDETFARLKPVISAWSNKVVHVGPTGHGHRLKLLNNFVALGYAAIYSEVLALSRKVGVTPAGLDEIIRGGRMECGFYQTFMRCVLHGDRDAHRFTISNALKDMKYVESMADSVGLVNPLGNAVKNSYASAVAAGAADQYVPMLAEHIARLNGLEPDGAA